MSERARQMGVCVVFDGPPGPVSGRFVEVVDENGHGIKLGKWCEREDGFWSLDFQVIDEDKKE